MISSAELLANFEKCARWGHWSRSWERHRMSPVNMLHTAVRESVIADVPDPGENAGEIVVTLAADRGLDLNHDHTNFYRTGINHACAADLITTAIRKNGERWVRPDQEPNGWHSSVLMDPTGSTLRRFLAVTHWTEDRAFYERNSWYSAGEIAHYKMPMQLVVAVLGSVSGGRRSGYWSKALLHPQGTELRFRLRRRAKVDNFKETWVPVWREEHDEIARDKWLACMMLDEVMDQSLFVIDIPVPEASRVHELTELAKRQLGRMDQLRHLPSKQLTTCHNPLHPCPFRACCWSDPESGPEAGGYDRIESSISSASPASR